MLLILCLLEFGYNKNIMTNKYTLFIGFKLRQPITKPYVIPIN